MDILLSWPEEALWAILKQVCKTLSVQDYLVIAAAAVLLCLLLSVISLIYHVFYLTIVIEVYYYITVLTQEVQLLWEWVLFSELFWLMAHTRHQTIQITSQ